MQGTVRFPRGPLYGNVQTCEIHYKGQREFEQKLILSLQGSPCCSALKSQSQLQKGLVPGTLRKCPTFGELGRARQKWLWLCFPTRNCIL
jgi:hypothetical protein